MPQTIEQVLQSLPQTTVPDGLMDAVLGRIAAEKIRSHMRRLSALVMSVIAIGSVSLAWSWGALQEERTESAFFAYFSALFADRQTFFAYWKDGSVALLESLPVLNVVALLIGLALLVGIGYLIMQMRVTSHSFQRRTA